VVATLDPTLAPGKLHEDPLNYSASKASLVFGISSLMYFFASMPIGWLMDKVTTTA
jgi:hypothetical protein